MLKRICFLKDSSYLLPNQICIRNESTFYDVLNVKKDCTIKEIRSSFLELSKQCHPDVKGTNDLKNTEKYLKIMEAYQVLSKTDSRRQYDLALEQKEYGNSSSIYYNKGNENWRVTPNMNPNPSSYYYGVKGIQKVSNMKIVGILLFLATIGTIFEFYLVRNSMTFRRDMLDEKSREAGLEHSNVRADAEKYGNEKQLKRITEKILQNRT